MKVSLKNNLLCDLVVGELEFGEEDGAVLGPPAVYHGDDLDPAPHGPEVAQVLHTPLHRLNRQIDLFKAIACYLLLNRLFDLFKAFDYIDNGQNSKFDCFKAFDYVTKYLSPFKFLSTKSLLFFLVMGQNQNM